MGRRRNKQKENWRKIILSVLILLCLYFILALFGSSLTGDSGQAWGDYLRTAWGGAVLVPLLFWLYLCTAKLLKLKVPYVPRQILGTIQLYISFAFMLGLLKETGWNSELTLFLPGNFGSGLAHFFVLNIGVFITLLLVIGSFILSAFLFGSKILRFQFPDFSLSSLKNIRSRKQKSEEYETNNFRRTRRKPVRDTVELEYTEEKPEDILFTKNIPVPKLKDNEEDFTQNSFTGQNFTEYPRPKLKPDPVEIEIENEYENEYEEIENINEEKNKLEKNTEIKNENNNNYAIEIIDNLLASIDAGALSMPEKKRPKNLERTERKKLRRPLPAVEDFENIIPEIKTENSNSDSVFNIPMEIFGPSVKFEISSSRDGVKFSEKIGKNIISTLKNFGVNASIADTLTGPSVIQYLIELAPGMKVNKISGLSEELAMSLEVVSVRIEAPIPGTRYVGIEIPNPDRKKISLRNIFESEDYKNNNARLPLPLGVQFDGKILIKDLAEMQHLLAAGNKDSGKNTFLNTSIINLCSNKNPEELRLILIDPRHVEFALYNGLPHLLTPPIFNYEETLKALQWANNEVELRTANFARTRVRTLAAYNRKLPKKDRLPEIVIFINELSDLMYQSGNEIEDLIVRLAQKSGSTGIYMIIAAQRPSADVITTLIRSNISARAAFSLSSQSESKNIIGTTDAEKLTGKGDFLFKDNESPRILRLQAPFISEEKISDFVEYMEGTLQSMEVLNFKEEK